jgi:hypothetical protein
VLAQSDKTGVIKQLHLDNVRTILSKIPKSISPRLPTFEIETPEENLDVIEISATPITSSLNGWKLAVFQCVDSIPTQVFTLADVNKFENHLRQKYPENNRVTAKIRQQLQYLRDLGLIEFLGSGNYKKLWK